MVEALTWTEEGAGSTPATRTTIKSKSLRSLRLLIKLPISFKVKLLAFNQKNAGQYCDGEQGKIATCKDGTVAAI